MAIKERRQIIFDADEVLAALRKVGGLTAELAGIPLDSLESVRLLPAEDSVSVSYRGPVNGTRQVKLAGPGLAVVLMRWCMLCKVPLPKSAGKSLVVMDESVVINITFGGHQKRQASVGSTGEPRAGDLHGLSILVVDDEAFMRSTLMMVLRAIDNSFTVTMAGDGETALRMISETKPELVLCDVSMEPMDGLEVVTRLRASEADPQHTTVMMLTAHDDDATIRRAAGLDVKSYLVKPVSPAQLRDRLETVFRNRKAPRSAADGQRAPG